jgi:Mor family transcriptional regulator
VESAIVATRARGSRVENCGGVSIYLPLGAKISDFYAETDFARSNRWPRLLEAYSRA